MAMLAGPRRKQKVINLRAKNSAWSNDSNKFGQKMLEKMGWSAGKGLGAKENGIVEHVVAKYKNDDKGLGYDDKNDQWTKHEDDFDSLLANLSNGNNNDDKLHSGISLEDKSKKSKTRVHYHKFTRGKDLTKYSEKDLANIFGKKSFKNEVGVEEIPKDDIKSTQQVFTEKGSMEDYFKNKLVAFKSRIEVKSSYNTARKNEDSDADCGFHGFSGVNDDEAENHQGLAFQSFSFNIKEKINCEDTIMQNTKKNKSKKRVLKSEDEDYDDCNKSNENNNDIERKKKKKQKDLVVEELVVINKTKRKKCKKDNFESIIKVSKKSKMKNKDLNQIEQPIAEESYIPKKKKKRKKLGMDRCSAE